MGIFESWDLESVEKAKIFWALFAYWGAVLVFTIADDKHEKKAIIASSIVSMIVAFQIMFA
jgi:hypothetical protein